MYFLGEIVDGTYSGLDDPKLVEDMLNDPSICADDGENYEQPSAVELHK